MEDVRKKPFGVLKASFIALFCKRSSLCWDCFRADPREGVRC